MKLPSIIATADGSSTLASPYFDGELYHSDRGAVGEAQHVYIRFLRPTDRVLEIGFGSGLNALLALQTDLPIEYTAIELYPVPIEVADNMSFACSELHQMHLAPWGMRTQITPNFSLLKIHKDLLLAELGENCYDTIFFDAFAPDVVPDMWGVGVFERLLRSLSLGGQLLTYSAKGSVKQALRSAGFTVERLDGALGKRHMVRAGRF